MRLSMRYKDSAEERRARGEISCAECRRHKLKCNRKIPCNTCIRKGCQSLCPNGLQTTNTDLESSRGPGTIKMLATDMSNRIRQLEDALQISHHLVSGTPHPLLAPDLLEVKNRMSGSTTRDDLEPPEEPVLIKSFGTLTVTNGGTELYIGTYSPAIDKHLEPWCTEVLSEQTRHTATLSSTLSRLSNAFPFATLPVSEINLQKFVEEKLPTWERASALAEAYLENTSWFFRPVDRDQLMEELIPSVYKKRPLSAMAQDPASSRIDEHVVHPHALGLAFVVFAIGAASDLTLPPWNEEADLYYHLARASLALKSVFDGCGLPAVQAIALLGAYDLFACRRTALEAAWKMISMSLSLSTSIGINRDPSHFNLPPKFVERRRKVFWELLSIDVCRCICTGRPLTFHPESVDCELPNEFDLTNLSNDEAGIQQTIWGARYRFIKDILLEVIMKLSALRTVKYAEILSLDQKIQDYNPGGVFSSIESEAHEFHWIFPAKLRMFKDCTTLCLHRIFFAYAIAEDSLDPIRTRFGPSFLSTFRSAASLVNNVRKLLERGGHRLMRLWPVWAWAINAIVALGSIAECGSASALAPQAYAQFNVGYEMISHMTVHPFVQTALPALQRLREQAQKALVRHGNTILPRPVQTSVSPQEEASANPTANVAHGAGDEHSTGIFVKDSFRPKNSMEIQEMSVFFGKTDESTLPAPGIVPQSAQDVSRSSTSEGLPIPLKSHLPAISRDTALPRHELEPFTAKASDERPFSEPSPMASGTSSLNGDLFNQFSSSPPTTINQTAGINTNFGRHFATDQDQAWQNSYPSDFSSWLNSPGINFDPDFDVSYDMRSFSGLENVIPLLPEDMAWRSFIQDSNFFGWVDGLPVCETAS